MRDKKNKTKLNDETLRVKGIDLIDDIELGTYIDARERYDYLNREYDQIVEENYQKNKNKEER